MRAVPPPSERVLAELDVSTLVRSVTLTATPLARTWTDLERARASHADALAALDRIEAELVAVHGHPRVALPATGDTPTTYAADPATIERHLGRGPAARRLTVALRRRQRRFAHAAAGMGLERALDREARALDTFGAATASLLIAPAANLAEAQLKLAVLIAAGEVGPPEAHAFPWAFLRTCLADLASLERASDRARSR